MGAFEFLMVWVVVVAVIVFTQSGAGNTSSENVSYLKKLHEDGDALKNRMTMPEGLVLHDTYYSEYDRLFHAIVKYKQYGEDKSIDLSASNIDKLVYNIVHFKC